MLYCMYMIEIYLEKKLKKNNENDVNVLIVAVLPQPAQRQRFYSKMCFGDLQSE